MICTRTCTLLNRDRNNLCVRKISRRESNEIHILNAIQPKDERHTSHNSRSNEQKSSIHEDNQVINYVWHRRMGHANRMGVDNMIKKPSYDMNADILEKLSCKTCLQTKANNQPAAGIFVEN